MAVAGELAHPARVLAAARRGLGDALEGRVCSISDRLWAYEIEEAAQLMLVRHGLADRITVHTNGETVSFSPVAR